MNITFNLETMSSETVRGIAYALNYNTHRTVAELRETVRAMRKCIDELSGRVNGGDLSELREMFDHKQNYLTSCVRRV